MTKKTLEISDIASEPSTRRSALARLGAIGAGAVAVVGCGGGQRASDTTARSTACTDQDPTDPAGGGRGRGISDSDPNDPVGCGSRACSDSDAGDPVNRGRHC